MLSAGVNPLVMSSRMGEEGGSRGKQAQDQAGSHCKRAPCPPPYGDFIFSLPFLFLPLTRSKLIESKAIAEMFPFICKQIFTGHLLRAGHYLRPWNVENLHSNGVGWECRTTNKK